MAANLRYNYFDSKETLVIKTLVLVSLKFK